MNLNKAMKQSKFDTRLVDFNMNNGLLTKEEYEQHLQSLDDLSGQAENLRFEGEDKEGRSSASAEQPSEPTSPTPSYDGPSNY